jgi:hypothetical protein
MPVNAPGSIVPAIGACDGIAVIAPTAPVDRKSQSFILASEVAPLPGNAYSDV